MKKFEEFITESKSVSVDTSSYEVSHGKKPGNARGLWMFARNKDVNFSKDKSGEDYFEVNNTYKEAVKAAKEWATNKNVNRIFVMP